MSEDDLSAALAGFGAELLDRLDGQATTLAEIMLARRSERQTSHRVEVHPPRGTTEFAVLHIMVNDDPTFVELLDRAVRRLTATEDGQWRVSLADPMTCSTAENAVQVMLHPADLDVSHLDVVPPEVRIYRFYRLLPYEIVELPPDSPAHIAYTRRTHDPILAGLQTQWRQDRVQQRELLLQTVRAEMQRQRATLSPSVIDYIDELLTKVMARPYGGGIEDLLQVASYLGIHAQVTQGFRQAPNE